MPGPDAPFPAQSSGRIRPVGRTDLRPGQLSAQLADHTPLDDNGTLTAAPFTPVQ